MRRVLANPTAASPLRANSRAPLARSYRENLVPVNAAPPKPSDYWLAQPAWIDGASNPPLFFSSAADIYNSLSYYNPQHPNIDYFLDQALRELDLPPVPGSGLGSENQPPSYAAVTSSGSTVHDSSAAGPSDSSNNSVPPQTSNQQPIGRAASNELSVSVVVHYPEPLKSAPSAYRSKNQPKMLKTAKLVVIDINTATRGSVVTAMLEAHALEKDYALGAHSGPPFKMSWTGSSGGKSGAPIIDTDTDFGIALAALKKKTGPAVVIEYNLNDMEGHRILKKRLSFSSSCSTSSSPFSSPPSSPSPPPKKALPRDDDDDDHPELLYGTKIPRVDDYSIQDQLQGDMILKIQNKWKCDKHQGENGKVGHCYIDVDGNHMGLNMRKFRAWAAAVVAGDATVHVPPNTADFDGVRDGRTSRPRGRRSAPEPSTSSDTSNVLLAAMLPILASMSSKADPFRTPPRTTVPADCPAAPQRPAAAPSSPVPARDQELHACLVAFREAKDIDMLDAEASLAELELTPDAIVNVPVARLMEVTGAVEGRVYKLVAFSRDWVARLEEKRRRIPLNLL
ncbi:hypothetical protein C8F01DRAFT_639347 [Mycena amicta]|nr:hypothetical protein C8F01DRAFT_1262677 [Mycena amicta]KAJ7051621.1 hypothetical protein C8F01DRAFT_639347 [Mycena amicta]